MCTHESTLPFVLRIEFIRSKLSNFSACIQRHRLCGAADGDRVWTCAGRRVTAQSGRTATQSAWPRGRRTGGGGRDGTHAVAAICTYIHTSPAHFRWPVWAPTRHHPAPPSFVYCAGRLLTGSTMCSGLGRPDRQVVRPLRRPSRAVVGLCVCGGGGGGRPEHGRMYVLRGRSRGRSANLQRPKGEGCSARGGSKECTGM